VQVRTFQPEFGDRHARPPDPNPTIPSCNHEICITCSDSATAFRIIEFLPGGLAKAEADGKFEEISVELIDAAAGDLVLVHAGVAIGKL
jgi:hypothetical protein